MTPEQLDALRQIQANPGTGEVDNPVLMELEQGGYILRQEKHWRDADGQSEHVGFVLSERGGDFLLSQEALHVHR